jgi:NADP-dependent aldehyde dehydrogenase
MGAPAILGVSDDVFLDNPLLHREVFGPLSLIVRCKDLVQINKVAQSLEGQITSTVIATTQELKQHPELIHSIQELCGRFILNGVPTGVEVSLAMHHGGPFPASTDSRFSSVGADGIRRFTRPVTFQNWQDDLLPDELKNKNSLQIWRTVNGNLTKEDLC